MNWTTTFTILTTTVTLLLSLSLFFHQVRGDTTTLYDYGRKLRITPKECQSTSPRFAHLAGICMFNLECQEQSGTVIGACVDRFLFGACCHVPDNGRKPPHKAENLVDPVSTDQLSAALSIKESPKPKAPNANDVVNLISEISSTVASAGSKGVAIPAGFLQRPDSIPNEELPSSRTPSSSDPSPFRTRPNDAPVSVSNVNAVSIDAETLRPTRFPARHPTNPVGSWSDSSPPRGVSTHDVQHETVDELHFASDIISNRERTTLSPTRDIVTLLPLTLETFSSVSDPIDDGPHGGHHSMHYKNGQSHDYVEHEALVGKRPRPSSSRIRPSTSTSTTNGLGSPSSSISSGSSSSSIITSSDSHKVMSNKVKLGSSSSSSINMDHDKYSSTVVNNKNSNLHSASSTNAMVDSTEDPPKISTFMYLDNQGDSSMNHKNSNDFDKYKYSIYPTTSTTTTSAPEEKTMSFYQGEDLNSNTENIWSVVMQLGSQNGPNNGGGSNAVPAIELLNHFDEISDAGDSDQSSTGNLGYLGNTMMPGLVLDKNFLMLKTDQQTTTIGGIEDDNDSTTEKGASYADESNDNDDGDDFKTTARPWASSTYQVHTFSYPNATSSTATADDSDQSSTKVRVRPTINQIQSTTFPSLGKITTWSGIGSVVDKEHLLTKHSSEEESSQSGQSQWQRPPGTLTTMLLSSTTSAPPKTTSIRSTTIKKATTRPEIITKRTTPTSTTTTTTEALPKTTTTLRPRPPQTTDKWKKPKPYTLPPHKRPTTPEPTVPPVEASTAKVSYATKKPMKIVTKAPIKKTTPEMPSLILDEDLDTNLDDFVEQVVNGLAGTLDNLKIDDVILPIGNSGASENSADPTVNPLQVISDPFFPFPIVGETPLTKHSTKTDIQQKVKASPTTTVSTTTTTPKPLDWKKDCGVRTMQKSGRIVGGTASKFGRWPWQALVKEATWLGLFSKNKCGGVLIAPKYVLTAAHCQPGFLATLTVVLGDFDISSSTESTSNAITKNVRRVIVHRDYNAQTFENDIALLELDSPVEYHSHIVPICLPTDDEEFIGKKAYVTGWGRLKYGGGVPQILHEVDVPIMKNEECQDMFHKSGHLKAIRESFICAGYPEGFKDSCEGDSGGPLSIQRSTGQWVLAGTVSHGIKCAYPNLPGVYMRMTFYKPWIKRVTGIK